MSLDAVEEPSRRESSAPFVQEVTAVPAQAAIVRDLVLDWVRERGVPADLAEDVKLVVYEAMANAIEHAYPPGVEGIMIVSAVADARAVTVTVADTGLWRENDSRPHGGRGLPIMRALAPEFSMTTTPTGTMVCLAWPWPPGPSLEPVKP